MKIPLLKLFESLGSLYIPMALIKLILLLNKKIGLPLYFLLFGILQSNSYPEIKIIFPISNCINPSFEKYNTKISLSL